MYGSLCLWVWAFLGVEAWFATVDAMPVANACAGALALAFERTDGTIDVPTVGVIACGAETCLWAVSRPTPPVILVGPADARLFVSSGHACERVHQLRLNDWHGFPVLIADIGLIPQCTC